ncbi:hypothetical protein F5Y16DRAFT_371576 [Xylariaceae sp. FL0255]|nr:hypothetical protein F5Y16DRAFT_371576 [Xylariaceae sp. FL0255]
MYLPSQNVKYLSHFIYLLPHGRISSSPLRPQHSLVATLSLDFGIFSYYIYNEDLFCRSYAAMAKISAMGGSLNSPRLPSTLRLQDDDSSEGISPKTHLSPRTGKTGNSYSSEPFVGHDKARWDQGLPPTSSVASSTYFRPRKEHMPVEQPLVVDLCTNCHKPPTISVDPPRPPKDGFEWVWFPAGYWAERQLLETESYTKEGRRIFRWIKPSCISGGSFSKHGPKDVKRSRPSTHSPTSTCQSWPSTGHSPAANYQTPASTGRSPTTNPQSPTLAAQSPPSAASGLSPAEWTPAHGDSRSQLARRMESSASGTIFPINRLRDDGLPSPYLTEEAHVTSLQWPSRDGGLATSSVDMSSFHHSHLHDQSLSVATLTDERLSSALLHRPCPKGCVSPAIHSVSLFLICSTADRKQVGLNAINLHIGNPSWYWLSSDTCSYFLGSSSYNWKPVSGPFL